MKQETSVTGEKRILNNVKVELLQLGEGCDGDYNKEDPDDIELLRFEVSYFHPAGDCDKDTYEVYNLLDADWIPCADATYCTQLPVSLSSELREKTLDIIMSNVYESVSSQNSIKRVCEELSWLHEGNLNS